MLLPNRFVYSPDPRNNVRSIILRHETDFEETIEIRNQSYKLILPLLPN